MFPKNSTSSFAIFVFLTLSSITYGQVVRENSSKLPPFPGPTNTYQTPFFTMEKPRSWHLDQKAKKSLPRSLDQFFSVRNLSGGQKGVHRFLMETHLTPVSNHRRALENWVVGRLRGVLSKSPMAEKKFSHRVDKFKQYPLPGNRSLSIMNVKLYHKNLNLREIQKAEERLLVLYLRTPRYRNGTRGLTGDLNFNWKNMAGRKVQIACQVFARGRATSLRKVWNFSSPNHRRQVKKLKISFPPGQLARTLPSPQIIQLLVTVRDLSTGELITWDTEEIKWRGRGNQYPRPAATLKQVKVWRKGPPSPWLWTLRAQVDNHQGQSIEFRSQVYTMNHRPVPGATVVRNLVATYNSTQWKRLAMNFSRAALQRRLGNRWSPYYVSFTIRHRRTRRTLASLVLPFTWGQPTVPAGFTAFLLSQSNGHVLLGTGMGMDMGFWNLNTAGKQAYLRSYKYNIASMAAVASRVRISLPPQQTQLVRLLLQKGEFGYSSQTRRNTSSGSGSFSNAGISKTFVCTFYRDQTCQVKSKGDVFLSQYTVNSDMGMAYNPKRPPGAYGSSNAPVNQRKQLNIARCKFTVLGRRGGPYWLVLYRKNGTTQYFSLIPRGRKSFRGRTYSGMIIDGHLEGRYYSSWDGTRTRSYRRPWK